MPNNVLIERSLTQEYILCNSIFMTFQKKQIYSANKNKDSGCFWMAEDNTDWNWV